MMLTYAQMVKKANNPLTNYSLMIKVSRIMGTIELIFCTELVIRQESWGDQLFYNSKFSREMILATPFYFQLNGGAVVKIEGTNLAATGILVIQNSYGLVRNSFIHDQVWVGTESELKNIILLALGYFREPYTLSGGDLEKIHKLLIQ